MATVAGGMNAIQFHDDGSLTGAACWRADGTPVGLAGGLAARRRPLRLGRLASSEALIGYFLTQITRTTDAFASDDAARRVDAIGLEKLAHRIGRHQHRLRGRRGIRRPRDHHRLQQRDAGEFAVAVERGGAGKAERRRRRQRQIAAAADLARPMP